MRALALAFVALSCKSTPTPPVPNDVQCPDGVSYCQHGYVCTPDSKQCTLSVFWCSDKEHWCYGGAICTPDNASCVNELSWCRDGVHWCSNGLVCSPNSQHCESRDDGTDVLIIPMLLSQ